MAIGGKELPLLGCPPASPRPDEEIRSPVAPVVEGAGSARAARPTDDNTCRISVKPWLIEVKIKGVVVRRRNEVRIPCAKLRGNRCLPRTGRPIFEHERRAMITRTRCFLHDELSDGANESSCVSMRLCGGTHGDCYARAQCGAKEPESQACHTLPLPNGSRLSCGALKKNSFLNLRAPSASSAC